MWFFPLSIINAIKQSYTSKFSANSFKDMKKLFKKNFTLLLLNIFHRIGYMCGYWKRYSTQTALIYTLKSGKKI